MNIIFFSHPDFVGHQSMPRLTKMFANGMKERGHTVEIWSPAAKFFDFQVPNRFKKWMGYIDQYLIFPKEIKKRLRSVPKDTIFVFTDQALGPWVPLVSGRPHVIHCNDFLAQRSALGLIPENPTSWTGKKYQTFIRNGYKRGKNFISISNKTQQDLHRFIQSDSVNSKVAYLGLNNAFGPLDIINSRSAFGQKAGENLSHGYLFHVGGNHWYKNRPGVVELYDAWRSKYSSASLPLIMIGENPSLELTRLRNQSPFKEDIYYLTGVEDEYVRMAYAGASVFLFPSLAEGFGWPIAEAMASGCPVITTNEAPMTEVAGNAAFLIDRRPADKDAVAHWANKAAEIVEKALQMNTEERNRFIMRGIENAKRFDAAVALDEIEKIYLSVVNKHGSNTSNLKL